MDQTPVFFSLKKKTVPKLDRFKTISMQSSKSDTNQAAVAVTVTASFLLVSLVLQRQIIGVLYPDGWVSALSKMLLFLI